MEYKLTKDQQVIFNLLENTTKNILLCGKPGVGKSVLIRTLIEQGEKFYTLAAPTALAAVNILGRTLHSIFRIPIFEGIIPEDYDNYTSDEKTVNYIRFSVKYLIIDEISMVRADIFDYIDRLLKHIKGNQLPFGGIQVIAIGDFYQLPPVTKPEDKKQLKEAGYKSQFVFDSKIFDGNFQVVEMNKVLRQKDKKFLDILDAARVGNITPAQIKLLNARVQPIDGLRIALTATNNECDNINNNRLRKIESPGVEFIGNKFGEWQALPVDEKLILKVGAQVMVKVNGADRVPKLKGTGEMRVYNGTLGKVIEIVDTRPADFPDDQVFNPYVAIELENGTCVPIYRRRWERKRKFRNSEGKWEEEVLASYDQMPLVLAWAISMHKSQGQTFDKVHIDASKTFAAGQLYVAISRSRSLDGVTFEGPLNSSQFFANMNVLNFFAALEEHMV